MGTEKLGFWGSIKLNLMSWVIVQALKIIDKKDLLYKLTDSIMGYGEKHFPEKTLHEIRQTLALLLYDLIEGLYDGHDAEYKRFLKEITKQG